ncbi:hypothetical protein ACUP6R_003950, partial [Vibrio navarrensis]
MSRPKKEFHQYLTTEHSDAHVSHDDYLQSPAVAFLKCTIEAKSSIDLCARHFPKKQDNEYTKDSIDSLQHLVIATLPMIMGHFETYQRHLFAGMFDQSVLLEKFEPERFFKALSGKTNIVIDWVRLAAYRDVGSSSIGTLLADTMT